QVLVGPTRSKGCGHPRLGRGHHDQTGRPDDQAQPVDREGPMRYDEASGIATEEVDGPIRSWKLEYDDGRTQYQFDIGSGDDPQEVTIDAETGQATVD